MATFLVHVDPVGSEPAGNRAMHVFDLERDLAEPLGQTGHGESQAGLGVEHPGDEQQQYED